MTEHESITEESSKSDSDAQNSMMDESGRPLLLIALDTSTPVLAAALTSGDELLASIQSPAERNHSAHVVPALQQLLRESGIQHGQLDGIVCGIGPGSYTGVRIAASVAKTLAWAWQLPIVGVSTLEAMAVGATREHGAAGVTWTLPLIDARRGQAYTALFVSDSSTWSRQQGDAIRLMNDWVHSLHDMLLSSPEAVSCLLFTGDIEKHAEGIELLKSLLRDLDGPMPEIAARQHIMDGRSVAWLGSRRLAGGETDDAHAFVPNYTQLAEAEAKLLEREAQIDGGL